jgi:hypothetical protein
MQNFKLQGGGRSPPKSIRIGPCSRAQQREPVSHTPCGREQTYNTVALADPVLSADDAENIVNSVSTLLYPDLPFHSAVGLFDCYHFFYIHTHVRGRSPSTLSISSPVTSFLLAITREWADIFLSNSFHQTAVTASLARHKCPACGEVTTTSVPR